jgi:lipid-binding SYLF domain-containing protein
VQKGSWGAQIGAQAIDLVLLVMNKTGMDKLMEDKVSLGAGASVAAGPVGRTAAASTDAKLSAEILSYSRARGAFAGIDLSGGVLGPDKDSNIDVYGPNVTARQILIDHSVTAPTQATTFVAALRGGPTESTPRATSGRK